MSGQSLADEIVTSSVTRGLATPMGVVNFEEPRHVALKGFPGTQTVHPVRWR